MKKRFIIMLLLMLGIVQTWADNFRWPDCTAIVGTAGVNTNEDYPKLLDNNTGTKWCVTSVSGAIHIDIDATRPIKPSGYVLTTGNDTGKNTGRNPKSWNIYWSDDKTNWTQCDSVSNGGMPTGSLESKTFMHDFGVTHRYWRFEVTSIVGGTVFQLSEFSFLVDHTNLRHVFIQGLQDIYYLAPGQSTINPQLTLRDLQGNTPAMGTNWTVQYQNANGQTVTSLSEGTYRLVIKPAANSYYYSDQYSEKTFKVAYIPAGSGTQADPYTISNISDWARLVSALNAGKSFFGQYVSLQDDIDLNYPSQILSSIMTTGDSSHTFCGTFLGNNHTITQTASYDNVEVCGLFRYVNGATFKDLTVAGSLTSSRKYMAAIVGEIMNGDVTFDNCHVTATLNSTLNGDGTSAPFVGYQAWGTATFRNCSFTGSLIGANTSLWGGMMAWGETYVTATFSNCIFAPTTINISSNSGSTYSRGRSGFTLTLGQGCYCTHQLSSPQGTLVYAAQQEGINKLITAADGNLYHMTCTVSGVQSQYTYSGEPTFPELTVTAIDAERLTEGTDYTLTYSDPTGRYPGQQTVTITGNNTTCAGSKTIAYTVVRDPSLPELQPGDVNVDGFLTISDVTAIVNMARGQTATNQWADVDGDGSVTTADADLLVANMLGKPLRLTLSASALTLRGGKTSQLTASFFPDAEYAQGITWTSSDPAVATVDESGLVTAVGSGSCTIAATAYGLTASCTVSVISTDDYVDLGLPSGTLWAKCNIGATQPQDYGKYFAWGETEEKTTYSWATYFDSNNGSSSSFLKYNTANMTLQPEDDAATVNLGAAWQMPTKAEMEELFNSQYTTCEIVEVNYFKGFRITSKVNGNSIFLPAAGFNYGSSVTNANYNVYYWTRTLYSYKSNAYCLYGTMNNSSSASMSGDSRYYGMPIRPVLVEKAVRATSLTLSKNTLALNLREPAQLTATVLPADTETKTLAWASSDPDVAKVDDNGLVEAVAAGTCTITVTTTDGSGLSASCTVTVAYSPVDGHEYVDLGLSSGTLWATTNIGALNPEDSGLYFAWGETTGYAAGDGHDFSWKNYIHSYVTEENNYDPHNPPFYLSKYNDKNCSYDGIMDNVIDLMPEDDAALTNWGTNWRLPTVVQIAELFEWGSTTQTQTTRNGVQGLLFTSKTYPDRSIFIPAAGHYGGSDLTFDNRGNIWIWAGTLADYDCLYAGHTVGYKDTSTAYRCFGLPVRPVVAYRCVESVTLSATEITCAVGDTIDLTFTLLPADAVDKEVRWIRGNNDVVAVRGDGVITAVAPGKCKITVQAVKGGAAASCTVTVTEVG